MEEEEKERRRVLEEKAKAKEAEKMEAQMLQVSERIRNDMPLTDSEWAAWYRWQALSSSSGRKRKKRKKKKLPRGGRAHRRHRQWQVPRWFSGFDASHAVFPSSVGMPEFPGILAGMARRTVVRSSSIPAASCAKLGLLVLRLAVCSL